MTGKLRVLFLCTANSARSQMAEGLLRALGGDRFEVVSAGVEPGALHPLAVEAMAEIGIDISHHQAKGVDRFAGHAFDYVIAVCDAAAERCPVFPGAAKRLHWSIDDPAKARGTDEERLLAFRAARDALQRRIEEFVTSV
jgi:arsenate reductase